MDYERLWQAKKIKITERYVFDEDITPKTNKS